MSCSKKKAETKKHPAVPSTWPGKLSLLHFPLSVFLGTKCHRRCESQWSSNTGNFHLARVKRPRGKSCPLDGCLSEYEALAITSPGLSSWCCPGVGGWVGREEAAADTWWAVDGNCSCPPFQFLRISHLEGQNGYGPGSWVSSPSSIHCPCALRHSQAGCLQT